MSDAAEILVIIISTFLGIFLLFAMVLLVLVIKVTRQIKSVTATAKSAAENLNSFTASLSKLVSPVLIARAVASAIKQFKKAK